jgi:NADH-quinone oxidoreductase subunit E
MKEKEEEQLSAVLERFGREKRLIPLLLDIQKELGYLPKEALRKVATLLGKRPIDVWGVATFFNQFRHTPLGKNHVKVCMGTACHLAGGQAVLEAFERELDIKVGETTADGSFSLDRVACIGCCMLSPVATIKDKIFPRMSPFKTEESLIPYRGEAKEED